MNRRGTIIGLLQCAFDNIQQNIEARQVWLATKINRVNTVPRYTYTVCHEYWKRTWQTWWMGGFSHGPQQPGAVAWFNL